MLFTEAGLMPAHQTWLMDYWPPLNIIAIRTRDSNLVLERMRPPNPFGAVEVALPGHSTLSGHFSPDLSERTKELPAFIAIDRHAFGSFLGQGKVGTPALLARQAESMHGRILLNQ